MPEPSSPATLYEWAGGMPALQRLTAHFYERVRVAPALATVFAQMPGDHPSHVAQFIAEVLGGPVRTVPCAAGTPT
jgi:hemoglobin